MSHGNPASERKPEIQQHYNTKLNLWTSCHVVVERRGVIRQERTRNEGKRRSMEKEEVRAEGKRLVGPFGVDVRW